MKIISTTLLFFSLVFPACAQNTLFPANPGDMIVRGTHGWAGVPGGTAGCVLTSNGPTAPATWQCALALNFQLPPIAPNTVWGNVTAAQAVPTAVNISQFLNTLDFDIQRPPLAGAIPYKGTDNLWHTAPPATSGMVWTSLGNGQIPQWAFPGLAFGGTFAAPAGRLTLTSGVPVTSTDVLGAAAVYYTAVGGSYIPVYNGTYLVPQFFTQLQLNYDSNAGHTNYHAANRLFDHFVGMDGTTSRLCTGPDWNAGTAGGATVRGTGAGSTEVHLLNGLYTNANSMLCRYGNNSGDTFTCGVSQCTLVGTALMTAIAGQTEDSKVARLVSNIFNSVIRDMVVTEPQFFWDYTTASFRQANNNAANKLRLVQSMPGSAVQAHVQAAVGNLSVTGSVRVGIGISSATVDSATAFAFLNSPVTNFTAITADYTGYPGTGLGYYELVWLEAGSGAGTDRWLGTSATTPVTTKSSISGQVVN